MTDAIKAAVAEIKSQSGERAIDALALSLSCEFLCRAAVEVPGDFRSLALVSPTGLGGRALRAPPGSTRGKPWLYRALRGRAMGASEPGAGAPGAGTPRAQRPRAGWGRTVYGWLTRPNVIRYFLRRTWGSPAIDVELWRYDIETALQPGAEFAPLYFLSGELFSADLHRVYERLTQPVFMSHGVRGDFTNYRLAGMITDRPGCRLRVYQTGALPYFEEPEKFCADYDAFLEGVALGPV
jgi:hypothetical protein